ncbi:hypothetical protein M3Y96_00382800 [Aphelenchoides besseyi]|nr:hypothetical protein M3Y96_00382800 [Aphelenchoides besseyi]
MQSTTLIAAFLQYELTFLLIVNRFLSVVQPESYNTFWTSKRTKQLIAFCVLLSILISIPVLLADCQIIEYEIQQYKFHYGPVTVTSKIDQYLKNLWSFHVYGLIVAGILCYSWMLRKLRKSSLDGILQTAEHQMFYVGLMVVLLNCVFTIYFLIRDTFLNGPQYVYLHQWLLMFISDLYDLFNGYLLWFTSSNVRSIVGFKCLKLKTSTSVTAVVVVKRPINMLSSRVSAKSFKLFTGKCRTASCE